MQIAILGIDLGKNSCSVVRLDVAGRVVLRRRLRRDGVIKRHLSARTTLPTSISTATLCASVGPPRSPESRAASWKSPRVIPDQTS
jgi:hypothetical protein